MKRQLLVIDDDPDILHVLKANLELYGYDPVLAKDWAAAKGALNTALPDLVILDLTLPARSIHAGFPAGRNAQKKGGTFVPPFRSYSSATAVISPLISFPFSAFALHP